VEAAVEHLSSLADVDAVLLVGSSARRSDADDVDVCALVPNAAAAADLERRWAGIAAQEPLFRELETLGDFGGLDLDVTDGEFVPKPRSWTTGPDSFELEIGNYVAHSIALWERNNRFRRLRERWLPYYDEDLRGRRLTKVQEYCLNNIRHVPSMVRRDEPFHAFHRLYLAFREFLQALFIARRTYPIAYDKWVREQVEGILGLPELYAALPPILGIEQLALAETQARANDLERLLETWTTTEVEGYLV